MATTHTPPVPVESTPSRGHLHFCEPDPQPLKQRWQKARAAIQKAGREIGETASGAKRETQGDETRWFSDHLVMMRAAVVETQTVLSSAIELVHVQTSTGECVPRVYAVAVRYFSHVDLHPSMDSFVDFLNASQEEAPLSCPEIWMLRSLAQFALLEQAAQWAEGAHEAPGTMPGPLPGTLPGTMPRVIRSMKWLSALDWDQLFLRVSMTDRTLRADPLGVYEQMDFESRQQYCREVVALARHSGKSEAEIAQQVVRLARPPHATVSGRARERREHVGYYLLDKGRPELREAIGYRGPFSERVREALLGIPDALYLGGILVATLLAASCLIDVADEFPGVMGFFLLLFPALECAVGIVNIAVTRLVVPRRFPRLDFSKGIPTRYSTMVVVPTLLVNEKQMREMVRELEIRYLANRDVNLHFALVTDPPDSIQQFDDKDALAGECSALIDDLNRRYAGDHGSFFHFHRNRVYSESEQIWMAWERKRGKLRDLNTLLQGKEDRFPVKTGNLEALTSIKFVITLDVDTELPIESARAMVEALAHPLNRAVVDADTNIVTEGYGILQPRVEVSLQSAAQSRMAAICSGETGLDIYTRAVSDPYQDLFGEGIFTGKGIYEVDVFQQVLEHRFPEGLILSHDLIEGAHVRAGLLSDVEVVDDYPSHLSAFSRRRHRWVRGDWQIVLWLSPYVRDFHRRIVRNPLSLISRWKIVDNLRRSLTEFATFLLLLYGWLFFTGSALRWTLAVLALLALPSLLGFAMSLFPPTKRMLSARWWRGVGNELGQMVAQYLFRLTFLCHQGLVTLDAAVRAVVRVFLTHRKLLEWETAAQSETADRKHPVESYLNWTLMLSCGLMVILALFRRTSLLAALPLLALWSCSPWISAWLARPTPSAGRRVKKKDRVALRTATLRTWRFFQQFTTAEDNWLTPDVVKGALVAHQVSPTNMGLLLNSYLAAYDLGYWTVEELAEGTGRTLDSMRRMAKHGGHFYNWYDSQTLEPKPPLFLSTVDNGNLVCSLWTQKQGLLEAVRQPLFRDAMVLGLQDHIATIEETIEEIAPHDAETVREFRKKLGKFVRKPWSLLRAFPWLDSETQSLVTRLTTQETEWHRKQAVARVKALRTLTADFAPWLLPEFQYCCSLPEFRGQAHLESIALESAPGIYASLDMKIQEILAAGNTDSEPWQRLRAALARSAELCVDLAGRLEALAATAGELADAMDFGIFHDSANNLLAIGYNAETERREETHYGLLASEARSAVFVAVARGDVSQRSWFALDRGMTRWRDEAVLLSWTGTMFEYLMPVLWMRSYPNTLLHQSGRAVVRTQQAFAAGKAIPWGISESSSAEENPDGHYRYYAFGVPQVAIKRRLRDDLVVSPYSSFLALPIDAHAVVKNLRELRSLGALGDCGFYDALDFTGSDTGTASSPDRAFKIARCWMAHHQGMIMAAAANYLCDASMRRRFHNEPRVVATERLLQEKPPNPRSVTLAEAANENFMDVQDVGSHESRKSE